MGEIRYLVKFSDGGVGMRKREAPLEVGDELDDCGERYRVVQGRAAAIGGGVRQGLGRAGHGRKSDYRDVTTAPTVTMGPVRWCGGPGTSLDRTGPSRQGRRAGVALCVAHHPSRLPIREEKTPLEQGFLRSRRADSNRGPLHYE